MQIDAAISRVQGLNREIETDAVDGLRDPEQPLTAKLTELMDNVATVLADDNAASPDRSVSPGELRAVSQAVLLHVQGACMDIAQRVLSSCAQKLLGVEDDVPAAQGAGFPGEDALDSERLAEPQ